MCPGPGRSSGAGPTYGTTGKRPSQCSLPSGTLPGVAPADKTDTAREYLRVSHDASGRERSIVEQQDENRAAWPGLHFTGAPYSDVSISASRYSRRARGGWARLLEDLDAGRFGADVLVLWESSRGSRRVGEWVDLIDRCEAHNVRIAVTTHGRTYDPHNGRDRRSLLEDAVDSEYESSKASTRLRRAFAANAAAGLPHGRVPFGYRRRYDERTRKLIAQEIEPSEAAVVRELYKRIAAGHSFKSVAGDLADRGVRNRSGTPFSAQQLRNMVTNDLYRGKRIHVAGRTNKRLTPETPRTLSDAVWPAIVDESTWLTVQHIIGDPARLTYRPGQARHLLSMIAVCDVCGRPLTASLARGPRRYVCRDGGHVKIMADDLDAVAEAVVLGYLARPDNVERLTAGESDGGELDGARLEVAKLRAELDDLADQVGRGSISATLAARAEPGILARLRSAEAHAEALATPSRLRGLITPGADVARRWKSVPMSARREIARILLAPDAIGQLRVTRAPSRGCEVTDRIVWQRATES